MPKPLSDAALRILDVIKQHPEGISEGDVKAILQIPTAGQAQFGRRRRELNAYYRFKKKHVAKNVLYIYDGPLDSPKDSASINQKDRAQVLFEARGRCGLCGRNKDKHVISLVVDHRVPRDWGGKTELDNLWALCEECNAGKKNYFKTVDSDLMRKVMKHKSAHVRAGETLKAFGDKPVPARLLEFVINQDQWDRRIRELRDIGWDHKVQVKRTSGGRSQSFYLLTKSAEWPEDPTAVIRRIERQRSQRRVTRRATGAEGSER